LIGSDTSWVLLKDKSIPDSFPNGSEVFTIGCQLDGIVDAVVVIILDQNGTVQHVYWRDDRISTPLACPLQESSGPSEEDISRVNGIIGGY
jgi:hypothetical protein